MKTIIIISENIPEEVAILMEECPRGASVYQYTVSKLGRLRACKNNLKEKLDKLKSNPPKPIDDMHLFAYAEEEDAWIDAIDYIEEQLVKVTARCRTLHRVCKYLYNIRHI